MLITFQDAQILHVYKRQQLTIKLESKESESVSLWESLESESV